MHVRTKPVLISFFCVASFSCTFVQPGPVTKDVKITTCSFPSFACSDRGGMPRCLTASEICDGEVQCDNSEDENSCEKDGSRFVLNNHLQSTAEDEIIIAEVTMQASFRCVGVLHNLQSNECKLIDARFFKKTVKPSLRGFWLAFELGDASSVTQNVTAAADEPKPVFDQPVDGREGEHDSIIVEIDLDAFPPERRRRQTGFSFPEIMGALANIFFGSSRPNQGQARSFGSSVSVASCGARNVEFDPPRRRGGRIINGVTPPYGAFPWQAAIKKIAGKDRSLAHHCGGAIISDRHVLTAAHCLIGYRRADLQVAVGEYDVNREDSAENLFEVEQFIIHYNYHQNHKRSDDIALVKIRLKNGAGFQFSDKIQPICLPSSESVYRSGQWCTASGWGIQKAGDKSSVSNILKAISVPILSTEDCTRKEVYGSNSAMETITEGMVCAGYLEGGIDTCGGDSGGPLACNINGQFQLLGLVSWGDGCARVNKPGVYVKVHHYIDWIQEWLRKL